MSRKKSVSTRNARREKRKGYSGTTGRLGTFMPRSEYEYLITELARCWKSTGRGIPKLGSLEWKSWTEQLYSMGRLSNVPCTLESTSELLRSALKIIDYYEGATEYSKLILGSSWRQQVESNKQLDFSPNAIKEEPM